MQIRKFTVPFAEILPKDASELEFGPGDYLVVRPIFSRPAADIRGLASRLSELDDKVADADADALSLELLETCVLEWHLEGEEGPIPMPRTAAALNALPATLRGALLPFLTTYRGKGPNPTTAG